MVSESVLLVPVTEAEPIVSGYRLRYDPSAAEGVPAHVTLLYPFVPPDQIDAGLISDLTALIAETEAFTFQLGSLRRFPEALYLAPDPDIPFRNLTRRISERFPEFPPYGGRFHDVIPHLTVACVSNNTALDELEQQLSEVLKKCLPAPAVAREALLMAGKPGEGWQTLHRFPFAA